MIVGTRAGTAQALIHLDLIRSENHCLRVTPRLDFARGSVPRKSVSACFACPATVRRGRGRPESYPTQDPTGGAGATPRHLRYGKRYGASTARQGRPEAYPGGRPAPPPESEPAPDRQGFEAGPPASPARRKL